MKMLNTQAAKAFYDDFGEKQDKQAFYEDAALTALLGASEPGTAKQIFEYGCGTGRFAFQLLSDEYASKSHYMGIDISDKMVALAQSKLSGYGNRVDLKVSLGETRFEQGDDSIDRFMSTYVLDLLPEQTIRQILNEAHRILEPQGLLCLVGITNGAGAISRIIMQSWKAIFSIKPSLVGGCRPLNLLDYVADDAWEMAFHETIVSFGIASEVLVARKT